MSDFPVRVVFRAIVQFCAVLGITATAAFPHDLCPDDTGSPRFDPDDPAAHALCARLWPEVRQPSLPDGSPKPLNEYEAAVGAFFNNYCHRDPALTNANGTGWGQDKWVRDTGPYIATRNDRNEWVGNSLGFHAPVVIWYSPDMMDWLRVNRPADPAMTPAEPAPVPDGAIIAKEMYTPPGSPCRDRKVGDLAPKSGIAYMIRDSQASQDGWFWGYFGFFEKGSPDPNIDWPARADNALPYAGFGQYCLNCHASAKDNSTFSSLSNIKGEPGEPLVFLSMDWFLTEQEGNLPEHIPQPGLQMAPIPNSTPLAEVPAGFGSVYNVPPDTPVPSLQDITLPSQSYDNVWAQAGTTPPLASEYLTSDQCLGCHDAGSTGLEFDMTAPNPHGDNLINLSPYATWRSSPMGLAGRDPIFFGQLASEEQFHPDYPGLVWNTCLGCHGIMGQRQYQLDQAQAGTSCEDTFFDPSIAFNPMMVTAIPYDNGVTSGPGPHFDPDHARYGALARDGISCVACHRTVLTPEQTGKFEPQPQNACVLERQQILNEGIGSLTRFGKTFTGSFLVTDPATLLGPFPQPRTKPMEHALGNIPMHDDALATSEQCGTCHTVHLPILWPKRDPDNPTEVNVIGDTYEQTTYPEWLFSQYRTGTASFLPKGETLHAGAGATPVSCAGCHLESSDETGIFKSRIASIQQKTNMPEAENTLPAADIDLQTRTGFARHTLVGLNLFLIKMAQQFNDVLGIPLEDPMLVAKGMAGLQRTEDEMVANARHKTARIAVAALADTPGSLDVALRIDNLAGHKFPSGVSFRRAFVEFEVLDDSGNPVWHSGATNEYGVLVDWQSRDPLKGELWYDNTCRKIVTKTDFQPHYQEITRPDQVQIYQEVKLDPGDPAQVSDPQCEDDDKVADSANLTTSFLSICHTPKDNRLLPAGQLPFDDRVAIARQLGLESDYGGANEAEKLAHETGAFGVGADPDYVAGGGDTLVYRIARDDMTGEPAMVRATLHYQATPPFFLQDRFCTGKGAGRDRLFHIASLLDVSDTPIEDWKFRMVSTGTVPIRR